MGDKKTTVIALLEILRRYTDEEHILSREAIIQHLEMEYGFTVDRRTFYNGIQLLQSFGYDISDYSQNGKGYYLIDRIFEPSEVILLCNAIHSSNFIPSGDAKRLIQKLLETQSKYTANSFNHTVYVDNLKKKDNKEFFYSLSILIQAIQEQKQVSFTYLQYDYNKKMVPRRSEPYIVSPYYLVYANEKTYLISKSVHHPDFIHYRLDRMKQVQILKEPCLPLAKKEDPYLYAKNKIYMYGGEEENIQLLCRRNILDDILDIFGTQTRIVQKDDDSFIASVKSSRQGILYLALQYLNNMEVLEPKDLREEVEETLKKGVKRYTRKFSKK